MFRKISLLLCMGFFLLSASPSHAQRTHEAFTLDGAVVLNAYQGMVEEHLSGVLNGLKTLAATQDAASGNWERVKGPLGQLGKDVSTEAAIWFVKPDGAYFTAEKGGTGENLKDREYFPALMAAKEITGTLVVSKSTGERSIVVAAPIVKDGHVVGALGATISATRLAKLVNDKIGLPDNLIFYALDANGLTALHRETSLIFQFPSDIGDASLKSAVQKMRSDPDGVVNYTFNKTHRTAIFQRSKLTGWVYVLGVTRPE